MVGSIKQGNSYKMKAGKIVTELESLKNPNKNDYFEYLEAALDKYHQMVSAGILEPRGNRVSIPSNLYDKSNK